MKPRLLYGDPNLLGERPVIGAASGDVIRQGHYSGTTVWSSSLHFGVFVGARLIGAMQFGPGMNPHSGGGVVEGTGPDEWLELNRLWLADDRPANTASRAISGALRVVHHARPRVLWVQSFADERCGKYGGVYQACSFLYCGSHSSAFYEIDGLWFHKSIMGNEALEHVSLDERTPA